MDESIVKKYKLLVKKSKDEIPCIQDEKIKNYIFFKNLIEKLESDKSIQKNDMLKKKVQELKLCNVKSYNKYIKKVNHHNLFFHLRDYHKNIKLLFLKKYCQNMDLIIDVGSSQLKSMPFWKECNIQKVIAMEPSKDLYQVGMKHLKRDFYGKSHVTFLQASGEENWNNGNAGLNDFSKKYLKNMFENGLKANAITFEFTFHYMIYKMNQLMRNIDTYTKNGSIVIIHCIDGNFLIDYYEKNKTNKYEVKKENDVVFYAEMDEKNNNKNKSISKKMNLKKVNIYFKGAQGLNNVVSEYIVMEEDIIREFKKYGFKMLEKTGFIKQNHKDFDLEEYELNVSKLYTSYVFQKI